MSFELVTNRFRSRCESFYDDIESHIRSLDGLEINSPEYGVLSAPVIIERLPHQLKLITGRNIKDKILSIIN